MYLNCPFCHQETLSFIQNDGIYHECVYDSCLFHGMPRYKCSYALDETTLQMQAFILEEFYIQVNYKLNFTKIHRLNACMLSDTVTIEQAVPFNLENLPQTLDKLRVWVTFS